MMKMKDSFFAVVFTALPLLIVLSACSHEYDEADSDGIYKIEVPAVKGSSEGVLTRALDLSTDGLTLTAPWKAGDTVTVFRYIDPIYKECGKLTARQDGITTILEGTVNGSFSVGDVLCFSYRHGLQFSYAQQKGTLDDIAENHDYALSQAEVSAVSSGSITLSQPLSFASKQCIVRFTLKDDEGNRLFAQRLVLRSYDKNLPDRKPYWSSNNKLCRFYDLNTTESISKNASLGYIYVNLSDPSDVIYVALSGYKLESVNPLDSNPLYMTATVGNDTYTYVKDSFSFELDKYYVYNVKMTKQE